MGTLVTTLEKFIGQNMIGILLRVNGKFVWQRLQKATKESANVVSTEVVKKEPLNLDGLLSQIVKFIVADDQFRSNYSLDLLVLATNV